MTNPLLRAVQEYLDNESAYVRDVEGEIQRLERVLDNERRQTQRRMIAALYWRAGEALLKERAAHTKWIVAQDRGERARYARVADNFGYVQDALETAASAMEAAL